VADRIVRVKSYSPTARKNFGIYWKDRRGTTKWVHAKIKRMGRGKKTPFCILTQENGKEIFSCTLEDWAEFHSEWLKEAKADRAAYALENLFEDNND